MYTLLLTTALAALAAAQSSVLTFTRVPNPITDGEPQAILYATNDTQSPVTIVLRQGASSDLQTVQTLTTSATGGQYIWTPPKSLPNGQDYALEIRQAGQVNYFGPFTVQGASPAAVSSASSAMSSASSTTTMAGGIGGGAAGNATMTSGNSTMTMTSGASSGTGLTMSRNATMSSASLTNTRTGGGAGATNTGASSSGSGAGFQGSSTAGSASASSTGNAAASDVAMGKSTLAFVLGAVAAVLYVH